MPDWLWLEQSALSQTIRGWVWLYPAIESLHLLGLALLVGSIALFDLRLLGISRQLWITALAQHLLPGHILGLRSLLSRVAACLLSMPLNWLQTLLFA